MVILYSCTLLLLMRSARCLKKQLVPGLMPPLEANTKGENEAPYSSDSFLIILSSFLLLVHVFDTWLQGTGNSLRECIRVKRTLLYHKMFVQTFLPTCHIHSHLVWPHLLPHLCGHWWLLLSFAVREVPLWRHGTLLAGGLPWGLLSRYDVVLDSHRLDTWEHGWH